MPDPRAVNSMFSRIAGRYDVTNKILSAGTDIWWRRRLVAEVRRTYPTVVLDLATGSGDVAFALSRGLPLSTRIVGMDFCQPMLDQAERKKAQVAPACYQNVTFQIGDGLAIPSPDDAWDAVTISFGLRNLADRDCGLREMRRVLRPGGHLFVLEFSQPAFWLRGLYYFYLRKILPTVAGVLTRDKAAYVYLNDTIEQFPDRENVTREIEAAGFNHVRAYALTFGIVALHIARK